MSDYRPICDVWVLARPKVPYYGAFPGGFVHRARELLGVTTQDAVLHVCAGRVRDYRFRGVGPNDRTLDIDPELQPDFVHDVRLPLPGNPADQDGYWPAILADPPYTGVDAAKYRAEADKLPSAAQLLALCLDRVRPGGRVGILHYEWPRPPKASGGYSVRAVALVAVVAGYGNSVRAYSVYEKFVGNDVDRRGDPVTAGTAADISPERSAAHGLRPWGEDHPVPVISERLVTCYPKDKEGNDLPAYQYTAVRI